MAKRDSISTNGLTHARLAEQYPCNTDPYGIWYIPDERDEPGQNLRWAVNDGSGYVVAELASYAAAQRLAETLRHMTPANTVQVDCDAFNKATLLLARTHGILDLIYTLAVDASGGDDGLGLCNGSLAASLDAAMMNVSEVQDLLSIKAAQKEVSHG